MKSQLLGSPLSAALLNRMIRLGAALGIPETVDRETRRQVERLGQDLREQATDSGQQLANLLGRQLADVAIPDNELEERYEQWLADPPVPIVHLELTIPQVRRAIERVLARRPPSRPKGSDEMRDCLIWEAVLELGSSYQVRFASEDGDFKRAGEPRPELVEEGAATGHGILMFGGLAQLLKGLDTETPPFPVDELREALDSSVYRALRDMMRDRERIVFGFNRDWDLTWYSTSNPNVIAIDFVLRCEAWLEPEPPTQIQAGHTPPEIVVEFHGEALFHVVRRRVEEAHYDRIEVFDEDGNPVHGFTYVLLRTTSLRLPRLHGGDPITIRDRFGDDE